MCEFFFVSVCILRHHVRILQIFELFTKKSNGNTLSLFNLFQTFVDILCDKEVIYWIFCKKAYIKVAELKDGKMVTKSLEVLLQNEIIAFNVFV